MTLYTLVSISKLTGLENRHTVRFEDRAEADAFAAQMEALKPKRAFWIEDAANTNTGALDKREGGTG